MKNPLCVAVCLLIAAGCSSGKSSASDNRPTSSATTAPAATTPPPRLSARIELPSLSIVAGSTEAGSLVIDNRGAPVRLTPAGAIGCAPLWSIVLANASLPQTAAFAAGCDGLPAVIRTGVTKLPFTLRSTFQSCSSTGFAQGALTPACRPDPHGALNVAPPLPAGRYRATFFTNDASRFVDVDSLTVRVVVRP